MGLRGGAILATAHGVRPVTILTTPCGSRQTRILFYPATQFFPIIGCRPLISNRCDTQPTARADRSSGLKGDLTVKCVIVVDPTLPIGLIANTAAVLAMSIGNTIPDIIGQDGSDRDGGAHAGITRAVVPVLKGDGARIRALRERLIHMACDDLYFVDFCDVAQKSVSYEEYLDRLRQVPADRLAYLGIAICGPDKQVNALTGNIGLLR
jgi:hypothetical protein